MFALASALCINASSPLPSCVQLLLLATGVNALWACCSSGWCSWHNAQQELSQVEEGTGQAARPYKHKTQRTQAHTNKSVGHCWSR